MSVSKKILKNLSKAADKQAMEALKPTPLQDLQNAVKLLDEAEERRQQITLLVAPEDLNMALTAAAQADPRMDDRVKAHSSVKPGVMYRLDEGAATKAFTETEVDWLLNPSPIKPSWLQENLTDRIRRQVADKNPFDVIKLNGL